MIGTNMKERPEDDGEKPRKGIVLPEDDLNVGDFVCVYSLKRRPDDGASIMGQSLEVKAINLPFFVAQLLSDPSEPVLTLDCRYLNMMRVTKEFVDAQREGAKQNAASGPPPQMNMVQPQKRKKPQQDG